MGRVISMKKNLSKTVANISIVQRMKLHKETLEELKGLQDMKQTLDERLESSDVQEPSLVTLLSNVIVKTSIAKKKLKEQARLIKIEIVGRILRSKSQANDYYEVHEYKDDLGEITLRRIYDQNQILLVQFHPRANNLKNIEWE